MNFKMIIVVMLLGLINTSGLLGQSLGMQYRRCANYSLNQTGTAPLRDYRDSLNNWRQRDISSDYDKRHVAVGNRWHTGLDFRDQDSIEFHDGEAIVSPEGGIVTQIMVGAF